MLAPTSGLAHITVRGPRRRVDLAVPHQVPLAELLPELLWRAGEASERYDPSTVPPAGGWVLRRADGTPLGGDAALAGQGVRDGDVLYLVPGGITWPEPAYDDVVEEVAAGARTHGRVWDPAVARVVALAAAAAVLVAGAGLLAVSPPPAAAGLAGAVAVGLLVAGGLLSRALGDGAAGAVAGGLALPYAAVAGLAGAGGQGITADRLLMAASAVLLAAVLGAVSVGFGRPVFVAGGTAALGAGVAALLSFPLDAAGAAAILSVVVVLGIGLAAPLAVRLGRVPVPLVTADPDLLAAERRPDRAEVAAAVARADDILVGCLLGIAAAAVGGVGVLAGAGGAAATVLGLLAALALLLRGRLFPAVAARLALLAGGLVALALVAVSWLATAGPVPRLVAALVGLAAAVALLASAALAHRRPGGPSPYLIRLVEVADVMVVVALAPTAFAVLGLYGWVRSLAG